MSPVATWRTDTPLDTANPNVNYVALGIALDQRVPHFMLRCCTDHLAGSPPLRAG